MVALDVQYLARDLYDVVEASNLSPEKRALATSVVNYWAEGEVPGCAPRGITSFVSSVPVRRAALELHEKTISSNQGLAAETSGEPRTVETA